MQDERVMERGWTDPRKKPKRMRNKVEVGKKEEGTTWMRKRAQEPRKRRMIENFWSGSGRWASVRRSRAIAVEKKWEGELDTGG